MTCDLRVWAEAQERAAQEEPKRKLVTVLESGDPIAMTPEYWEKKRGELVERHQKKTS